MKSTINLLACGVAIATIAACVTGVAQATTYVGERSVGTGTVDLSLTTDGALGVLSSSDITDYGLTFTNAGQSFHLSFADGDGIGLVGDALTATASSLLFDFGDPDAARLVFSNFTDTTYCLTSSTCQGAPQAGEIAFGSGVDGTFFTADTGDQAIASVGGVPEPATWAMMLSGFYGLGSALRARRRQKPTATLA